jgi:feruloyl esterase
MRLNEPLGPKDCLPGKLVRDDQIKLQHEQLKQVQLSQKNHKIWATILVSIFLCGLPFAQGATVPVGTDDQACSDLARTNHDSWFVISARFVHPPLSVGSGVTEISVSDTFCRVSGRAKAATSSDIEFELWLPPRTSWNGKFAGVGSGGSTGIIQYPSLSRMLARGYATVATDNGHHSEYGYDVTWAFGLAERITDFGYRAQHVVTEIGKTLTGQFYGRSPQHSYFIGCSQGGHHALTEAQRFPDDYDGIVAGAPVYNWTNEMAGQAWNVRALRETPAGSLAKGKLTALYQAVIQACGGADGLVDDPRQCSFDPATIQCRTEDSSACLSAKEVSAVKRMYEGPRTSGGVQIYPGLSPGGEGSWERLWSNPKHLGGSWEGFYRFMVFDDPSWDLRTLNFDRDPAFTTQKLGTILDPDNPDLTAFAHRGGKLIVYHGWGDDMVPSQVSIDYWTSVNQRIGAPHVDEFFRLFMIPGMAHCGGGPGADIISHTEKASAVPMDPERDILSALEQWVERGRTPANFVTSRINGQGLVERTTLICSYPVRSKYRGEGDTTRAESFVCSAK